MCVPACQEKIARTLSRRDFLKTLTAATMTMALGQAPVQTALAGSREDRGDMFLRPVHRLVDLTHTTTTDFPTFFGAQQLFIRDLFTLAENGFNMKEWTIVEHTGTHIDAPFHFSLQDSADEIPLERLILPLAVIDIRAKAAHNPDAQVTPHDIRAWERRYGRLPQGSCVAMLSGWGDKVRTPEFRNADASGVLHFPGFHVEAADFLIERRDVIGIAVDTLSLDFGPSPDFATHFRWLPTNRWGLEAVANLDQLPPNGATIVAAVTKVAGATGGPTRVIALVHRER